MRIANSDRSAASGSLMRELLGWFVLSGLLGVMCALVGGYLLRVSAPMIFLLFPSLLFLGDVPGTTDGVGGWIFQAFLLFGSTFLVYGLLGTAAGYLLCSWRKWMAGRPKKTQL